MQHMLHWIAPPDDKKESAQTLFNRAPRHVERLCDVCVQSFPPTLLSLLLRNSGQLGSFCPLYDNSSVLPFPDSTDLRKSVELLQRHP